MKQTIEELLESAKKLSDKDLLDSANHAFLWRQDYTNHGMLKALEAIAQSLDCSKAEPAMVYWLQNINRKVETIQDAICIPQEQDSWEDETDNGSDVK